MELYTVVEVSHVHKSFHACFMVFVTPIAGVSDCGTTLLSNALTCNTKTLQISYHNHL